MKERLGRKSTDLDQGKPSTPIHVAACFLVGYDSACDVALAWRLFLQFSVVARSERRLDSPPVPSATLFTPSFKSIFSQ